MLAWLKRCSYLHRLRTDMAIVIPRMTNNRTKWYNSGTLCRSAACPDYLFILCEALSGGWLSSRQSGIATGSCTYANTCGGSGDTYATYNTSIGYIGLALNVWKALDDGLWASSVSFSVYRRIGTIFRAGAMSRVVASEFIATKTGVLSSGGTSVCNDTNPTGTVTVYDDGTITAT
jgi:hypothetical protein